MFELSEKYRSIADDIINNVPDLHFIDNHGLRVAFLSCDKAKLNHGHAVRGECFKVPEMYKVIGSVDFIIVVYEPNCQGFTDLQFKILIEHELRHIGFKNDKPVIVPHDFERGEFAAISEKYGENWDT